MNILTKICVVVLLVTSLVACVVFVNMATNQANYKYYYEQEKLNASQKASAIRTQMHSVATNQKALATARTKFIDDKDALQKENYTLRLSLKDAERKIVKLEQNLTILQASLDGLSQSRAAHVKTNESLLKNLTTVREEAQSKHAAAISFETLLKTSQAKAELLEKEMSVLKDRAKRQKAAYITVSEKLDAMERRHGIADKATPTEPLPPSERIVGTITALRDNLASINIGSASGLKKGMKLIIYRGDSFVGHLKLENVDVNEAAGILDPGNPLAPLKGDKVTTKLD